MFKGVWTALITPMKEDGSVDYEGLEELIEFQIENSVDGLVPLGTTGETQTLTEDEEGIIIGRVLRQVNGRVPVVFGTGSNSTASMIQYTIRARDYGASGALVVTPYYNKPNDSGLIKHFEEASKLDIPIMVYNIPGRTSRNIDTKLMKEIASLPNIVSIKEAAGDINQFKSMVEEIKPLKENFTIMVGDDSLTLNTLKLGGDGIVSVASNIVPKKIKQLVTYFNNADFKNASNLNEELSSLFKDLFVETNPVPIKYAMKELGLPSGPTRLPLGDLSKESISILKETLIKTGLLK